MVVVGGWGDMSSLPLVGGASVLQFARAGVVLHGAAHLDGHGGARGQRLER